MTIIHATAQVISKKGIFAVSIIDFDRKVFVIHNSGRKEEILFSDIGGFDIETSVPVGVIPK